MENIFYDNGNCTLVEGVIEKCMYEHKYVCCEDCTKRTILESYVDEEFDYEDFDEVEIGVDLAHGKDITVIGGKIHE